MVLQRLRPRAQDVEVRVVLDVENPANAPRLHHVHIAKYAERCDEPAALLSVRDHAGLVENDTQLARLDRVDHYLGMGCNDELGPVPGGGGP